MIVNLILIVAMGIVSFLAYLKGFRDGERWQRMKPTNSLSDPFDGWWTR